MGTEPVSESHRQLRGVKGNLIIGQAKRVGCTVKSNLYFFSSKSRLFVFLFQATAEPLGNDVL
jgi:hypothetical protein